VPRATVVLAEQDGTPAGGARILDLDRGGAELPPPAVAPAGIELATWAERFDLARRIHAVASEAWGDIPGADVDAVAPFEDWLREHMQARATSPRPRPSRSPAARSSATRSCRSRLRSRASHGTTLRPFAGRGGAAASPEC
jgi:hypothetical protein